ncbi:unnamed protein product, partial [Amoebophrya sp. A25]
SLLQLLREHGYHEGDQEEAGFPRHVPELLLQNEDDRAHRTRHELPPDEHAQGPASASASSCSTLPTKNKPGGDFSLRAYLKSGGRSSSSNKGRKKKPSTTPKKISWGRSVEVVSEKMHIGDEMNCFRDGHQVF